MEYGYLEANKEDSLLNMLRDLMRLNNNGK